VTPSDFGIKSADFALSASRDTAEGNAQAILDTLSGQYDTPLADFFCMNSAAALYISGWCDTYAKGMEMSKTALANGEALKKLEQLREFQGFGQV
jgi:anthranilate phosphoribosyltransferase